jgi:hypothetical protein
MDTQEDPTAAARSAAQELRTAGGEAGQLAHRLAKPANALIQARRKILRGRLSHGKIV